MLFAKVVMGIAIDGPFDYSVPDIFCSKIKTGSRVLVYLRNRKMVGYVVGVSGSSKIKNVRPIIKLLDDSACLDEGMLLLTKKLSEYYCCSWGEAIESALPEALRGPSSIDEVFSNTQENLKDSDVNSKITIVEGLDVKDRWNYYLEQVRQTLERGRSAIVLVSDIKSLTYLKNMLEQEFNTSVNILYRKEPNELEQWLKIRKAQTSLVIGARSGIFAPAQNLGLIIVDEEENSVYKQDQVPHYHARTVALMRAKEVGANLILASRTLSLESFYMTSQKGNRLEYLQLSQKDAFPEVNIVDMNSELRYNRNKGVIFSRYLQDAVMSTLTAKGKVLLFLNRKGFATFASCNKCGHVLKCPRCSINLVYHFTGNLLSCHYCSYKIEAPKICPSCNVGYIKFGGVGTEKIESEISRIFPQAKVRRCEADEKIDLKDTDIFISTSSIIKSLNYKFDLVAVLGIDNTINRIDFRASEKAFAMLVGLMGLVTKKMIIQTVLGRHYCFDALQRKDLSLFYKEELKQRKQLKLPPYKHLILVKFRGKIEESVKAASLSFFENLKKQKKPVGLELISVNAMQLSRLRGNYYWQVLISVKQVRTAVKFLKLYLKGLRHSGIIVTVDVDPA
ncbi:MAG: primosomal protein N' [Candidatus Omnitrophica bacterium]|nr:primosomal protein N' [Candidatus Omnitrophota bacterium]